MQIDPHAFSEDEYLINQPALTSVAYGLSDSGRSGCGWIAAYNFLRALGACKEWQSVHREVSRGGLVRGLLGTGPFRLYRYLRRRLGRKLCRAYTRNQIIRLSRIGLRAGVLLYRHRTGMHYVAFTSEAGAYRFLNAMPGCERHVESMETFLRTHAKPWPLMLIASEDRFLSEMARAA